MPSIRTYAGLAVFSLFLILYFMWETETSQTISAVVYEDDSLRFKQTVSGHIKHTLHARKKLLNRQCDKLNIGTIIDNYEKASTDEKGRVIVNDKYKVLYCYVPKVASTDLKRIFLILTGKMNETDPLKLNGTYAHRTLTHYFTYLHTLPEDDIMYRLYTYKKVVFVRDPLTRILSAYRNKFVNTNDHYFKRRFGTKIIKRFRRNPSKKSLTEGHDVKFSEFVDYLLNTKTKEFEPHWDLVYNLCSPCHIRYNFIGKLETLEEDVHHLLNEIAADDVVKYSPKEKTSRTTESIMWEFYKEIAPGKIVKLLKKYELDYSLFGYEVPEVIRDRVHL